MTSNRILSIALCILTGFSTDCRRAPSYEKPPIPVGIALAQTYNGNQSVRYSANVEPFTRLDLAFKVGGYVSEIMQVRGSDGRMRDVQEGDTINQGAILAQVRQSEYEQKLGEAKSKQAEAQALLEKANEDFGRANRLFEGQNITKPDFEAARAQWDAAQARVQGAQALVEEAQIALRDTSLRSPMRGVVLKRLIEMGSLVGPGTPAFSIADLSSVKVVYGVPDNLVRKAKLGSPMTISTEAVPGRQFLGRITAIAPNADPRSRLFDVEITVQNSQGLLKAGMIASLEVADGEKPATPVVVPISAIVRSRINRSGYELFVVERRGSADVARAREVTLGEVYGNLIGASSGVDCGEKVIVTGATIVADGQGVRVIP